MQAAVHSSSRIPLGTPVVYFNQWNGFDSDEIRSQFTGLTAEELRNLKQGDIVYIDVDPLNPHGKVYGRVKVMISNVLKIGENTAWLDYNGAGFLSGGCRVDLTQESYKLARSDDEEKLADLLEKFPIAKRTDYRS